MPGHGCDTCYHLTETGRPNGWRPFPDLWCFAWHHLPSQKLQETSAQAISTNINDFTIEYSAMSLATIEIAAAALPDQRRQWLYNSSTSKMLTPDRSNLANYHEYDPGEEPYTYNTAGGGKVAARGHGIATITIDLGNDKHATIRIKAYYNPDMPFGIFSSKIARKELGIY